MICVPDGQVLHVELAPAVDHVPGGHARHPETWETPDVVDHVPAGHRVQLLWFLRAATEDHEPVGQERHDVGEVAMTVVDHVPELHNLHKVLPKVDDHVLLMQLVQVS